MIMRINKAKAIDDAVRSTQLMEAREEERAKNKQKIREIALNLLKTDLSVIQISEATGMPVEDIKKLKEDQK
jgi:predicted transposase YdaD